MGFGLLQFVAFPLIAQLSVFAMISLAFSYFQFTFIYPYFGFTPQPNRLDLSFLNRFKKRVPTHTVFIFSILTIIYASLTIEFDYNLKNLDYQNIELQKKQAIIQDNLPQKTTLLIEASTPNELIKKAHHLQLIYLSTSSISTFALSQEEFERKTKEIKEYNFKELKKLLNRYAKELGFKEGYFSNAYDFIDTIPKSYQADLTALKALGYEVLKRDNLFYTIATIDKKIKIKEDILQEGVYIIDGAKLIKKTTTKMFESLILYMFIASLAIVCIIIFWVGKKSILALNFILFPIAIILLYLSFIEINIMHLFSIIIIIVAGIDYGIYMSQKRSQATTEAIFYSLLTSFSGFGILILSSIGAIHSIGVVITIGIVSILGLVVF